MSDDPTLVERLAAALDPHLEAWPVEEGIGYHVGWKCECGVQTTDPDDVERGREWHAAHVAAALAPLVEQERREAARVAWDEGYTEGFDWSTEPLDVVNPYGGDQ